MKYYISAFVLLFIFLGINSDSFSTNSSGKTISNQEIDSLTLSKPDSVSLVQSDTISIIGVGDIMMGTNYPSNAYLPPNDGKDLLAPVIEILRNADLTFGNCEGGFLDSLGTVKQCKDSTKCYAFRQPTKYVQNLVDAGFDLLSIANNHVGDFGEKGRLSTIQTLDSAKLIYAGLVSCPYSIFERNGVKFGFTAFAPNSGTLDINDIDSAKKIVSMLDSLCDIVIVSFHGGGEGPDYTHVPKKSEKFVGENRGNVHKFAHSVIDAGADIVFGHGPHVTRALELYENRIIAYSLGNFCTYSRFNLSRSAGVAPILKVYINKKGEFLNGMIYPIKQLGDGGPQLDEKNKVIKQMISLTKSDFPKTSLQISESGEIKIKSEKETERTKVKSKKK